MTLNGLRFEPPIDPQWLVLFFTGMLALGALLRIVCGSAARQARRRWDLAFVRLLTLLPLVYILSGPVWVDEAAGRIERPDLFCLLDSSQSMDVGQEKSRWMDAVDAIELSRGQVADDARSSVKLFRFGHRLSAIESGTALSSLKPADSDTRLAEALRQLTGRFGRQPPAGIVLFSDGRVRDVEDVRQLARHYAERGAPIHVFPPRDTGEGGDVAIVSVVAPPRVRKYSDVEVQVFLRSSGYSGQRTEVALVVPAEQGRPEEVLSSVPITLRGGAQSVPLSYRSDVRGRRFEVRVTPMEDEISTRNNAVPVEVDIDRPKIRVLYVEGSSEPVRFLQRLFGQTSQPQVSGPHLGLYDALSEDEDIECVPLVRRPGGDRLTRAQIGTSTAARVTYGFPRTQAELSAFDCVILSDAPRTLLTETELEWLERWVANRGGGLLMAGGADSFAAGGWARTPLTEVLPVSFEEARWVRGGMGSVAVRPEVSTSLHPVWQIVPERAANLAILENVPSFPSATLGLRPKPLTDVLATLGNGAAAENSSALRVRGTLSPRDESSLLAGHEARIDESAEPLIVAGRYGRGRTMALAFPIAPPDSGEFMENWGSGGNRNAAKFWRNVVYWLTENSSIGRRRLVASVDKRFYRPGETIRMKALAYDETASQTTDYRVWGMIEPRSFDLAEEDLYAPIHWPDAVPRESGEEGTRIVWGEEFELPRNAEIGEYMLPLELTERLGGGLSDQGFRVELTAYEGSGASMFSHGTQVDSTSLEIQILDDPFEQQNTSANHDLLRGIASLSGGQVLQSPGQLADLINALPIEIGPSTVSKTPAWSQWWLLAAVLAAVTVEWLLRRARGLA